MNLKSIQLTIFIIEYLGIVYYFTKVFLQLIQMVFDKELHRIQRLKYKISVYGITLFFIINIFYTMSKLYFNFKGTYSDYKNIFEYVENHCLYVIGITKQEMI